MIDNEIRPFELLKLIRDGVVTHMYDLQDLGSYFSGAVTPFSWRPEKARLD